MPINCGTRVNEKGTFLAAELDHLFDDVRRLVEAMNEHLDRLNGYAVVMDAGYRRVLLRNKFVREGNPAQVRLLAHDERPRSGQLHRCHHHYRRGEG